MDQKLLKVVEKCKAAGWTRTHCETVMSLATGSAAKKGRWRPSELAMALADQVMVLDRVFGKAEGGAK